MSQRYFCPAEYNTKTKPETRQKTNPNPLTRAFWKSDYEEAKASVHPVPRKTQAGEYEVIIPALHRTCPGRGRGGGGKMTGA